MTDELNNRYDAIVVGGGAAGLNGAMMLARSRRSVAVIDAGAPRNASAVAAHGLLARDGVSPAELLERGRAEVRGYGGHVVPGDVVSAASDGDGEFIVSLVDGRSTRARRLLVASGLVDELPEIPGLREHWGHAVVHCPYCHGWEVRDQAIGVLASGPMAVHSALVWRQLSADVVFFTHTATVSEEHLEQLVARGVRLVNGEVVQAISSGGRFTGARLADGTVVEREVLAVLTRKVARAAFLADLGLKPIEHPWGVGEYIFTDSTRRTEIPGVWAAGNVTDVSAQIGDAAGAGAFAGMQINSDLVSEDAREAVRAYRAARPVSGS